MQVVHSDLIYLIDAYTAAGIILANVSITDELTARITVERKYIQLLCKISEKQSAKIDILHCKGILWVAERLLHRSVLLVGVLLLLLLSFAVTRMILFVDVDGNIQIPAQQIVEAAEQAGIQLGTPKRKIRSEQIKNRLIDMLPQLQWVGITIDGCTAKISVRERYALSKEKPAALCAIVAARDGIIQSMHVAKGAPLCVPGQAVKKGELLVSAYTNSDLYFRATGAEAEIYAITVHKLDAVLPPAAFVQGAEKERKTRCSLIVGKKRINFYKDSGICDTRCDKMYEEYYVTLPGGFRLPLAIAVERLFYYESTPVSSDIEDSREALMQWCEAYVRQEMVAGQILSAQTFTMPDASCAGITGIYRCHEMIGRLQQEEIAGNYGKTD